MASKSQVSAAAEETPSAINCSICLEDVIDDNSRAIAKLKCGHTFHLSCIGCEFNAKGMMQCPICRSRENSDWRFCIGVPGLDLSAEDVALDDIPEDSDEEMMSDDDADQDQDQNQNHNYQNQNHNDQNQGQNQNYNYQNPNIFQCPCGNPNCPSPHHDNFRPTRSLQIGGNSSNIVFPDFGVYRRNYFFPTPALPAPPSTPYASNVNDAAIGLANNVLNRRPLAVLDTTESAPFVGTLGGHESSHFPPNLPTNPVLHGAIPPSPLMEVLLASRGEPHWATRHELSAVGGEPSTYNHGIASTNRVELNAEQLPPLPPFIGDYSSNPNDAVNPEAPNVDAFGMINFL